jgi:tRNA A-37 threonylcarbamoyl transferase component Bud32
MDSTPNDDALLAAALELTDRVPAARGVGAGGADPHAPLDATSRSLDRLGLLADVAAAHAAAGGHGSPGPGAPEPVALFAWGALRVLGHLGEGSFGEVFVAWDPALQREVALKLRRARAGTLRWLDEARSLARVRHPNVLVVYGADLRDERAGMWSERIRGRTLEQMVTAGEAFELREAVRVTRDVAAALEAVHRTGLVHGDVTTRNVMLEDAAGESGRRAVLMDFGTASDDPAAIQLGTPLAAAPEVLAGGRASPASDVYSLGVLLFRLLTARYPVEAGTLEELRVRHAEGRAPAIGSLRRGVPPAIARIVERALAPEPARRFPSAAAMRDALSRALGEFVPPVRPRVALTVFAGLAVLAVISLALVQQYRRQDTNYFPPLPARPFAMSTIPAWTTPLPPADMDGVWRLSLGSDFDHDGRRDAVMTSGGFSRKVQSGGRALLYRGVPEGLARVPQVLCEGTTQGERLGEIIGCPGDVNGDGWPDVLVGTMFYAEGSRNMGEMRLLLGGPHGLATRESWRVQGDHDYSAYGDGMERVGDVNGDRCDDILIPQHDWTSQARNQGRVRVYLGSPSGPRSEPDQVLTDELQAARFGHCVRGVGDVDGDGFADVMVGSPLWRGRRGETGCALLYLGGPHGLAARPVNRVSGFAEGDLTGFSGSICGVGDLDADGYADVAIGSMNHASRASGIGRVVLYRGGPHGLEPRPVWSRDGFGSDDTFGRMVTCGDVNGDGRVDLVVGAPSYGTSKQNHGEGAVFVFLGAGPGRWFSKAPDWWVTLDQPGCGFGTAISAGDANGDGVDDLLVSAPQWHQGSNVIGHEFLYLGRRQGPREARSSPGPRTNARGAAKRQRIRTTRVVATPPGVARRAR